MTQQQLIARQRELQGLMATASEADYKTYEAEYNKNKREIDLNNQEIIATNHMPAIDRGAALREIMTDRKNLREISLSVLSDGDKNNMVSAGAVALTVKDILPDLDKGLIWDKVGLSTQYGVKGDVVWPYSTNDVEMEEPDELVALTDQDINFANKRAVPHRIGATVRVSNESIDNGTFDLLGFVQKKLTRALQNRLNKKMFSPANWTGLAGPFKNMEATAITGTYANIIAERAKIAATGVDMSTFAYVVSNRTEGLLKSTPKFNGHGGAIIENGMIDGEPVFVTEFINDKASGTEDSKYYMEMGCFGYVAGNQHGVVRLVVDPISEATKNATKVTINTEWSITDLATAEGAWTLLDITPANDGVVNVNVTNTESAPVNTKEVASTSGGGSAQA